MSLGGTSVKYTFQITVTDGYKEDDNGLEFVAGNMTDSVAFALRDAIIGLDWPTGVSATVLITKREDTGTLYTTDLTTTPPSFT
jgi:hypothetical protein